MDLAHWNTSFEVFGSQFEFSPNTLAVYFNGGGLNRPLIIDLSGNASHDVCQRKVRIPTKPQYWIEWENENTVNKLYRYFFFLENFLGSGSCDPMVSIWRMSRSRSSL